MMTKEQQQMVLDSSWVVNTALQRLGVKHDEDLIQEGNFYLCKCSQNFNKEKNVLWSTYAYKSVYLYLKRVIKKRNETLNKTSCIEKALEIPIFDEYEYINTNNDIDNEILRLKVEGYTIKEISKIVGCSLVVVSKRINSIKETIKNNI